MELSYIIAPLLGGVIGYITNDIAIRMLFRPHKAKYVFGIHIPFTPGIIPKEKGRIAEAVGGVISENLMNKEVLEKYLLSEDMVGKVRSAVKEFIATQQRNDETVVQFLGHYLSKEEIDTFAQNINQSITKQTYEKLADSSVGEKVAHIAIDHVAQKLTIDGAQELLSGIGGALGGLGGMAAGLFGGNIVAKFLGMLRDPAEHFLAKNINTMLRDNGEEIVSNMIGGEVDNFLNKPVSKLLERHEEQLAQAVNTIESIYRSIITEHLPKILQSIDISKIVRERINEMDVNETEKLIFQVMDKELKAIVWLGALLGLVMGSINILI
ncbi:hypothetical protein CIK92_12535 [Prevotella sp. P4-67]|uniref:DUF445 domain-containing protein n=1 Tax=Prevotella sp. P4-67 TaxID=2024227 RepID=UPI000B967ED7|nr:DUF445 family protein [Prevotella sp. P4-67]OYP69393.1 hypothetical protein CIK92_12535 [Prevotella sp. P4-67]